MEAAVVTKLLEVLGSGTAFSIFALVYLSPEKFEKWKSILYGILAKFFRKLGKGYAAYDIQGRVNEFVKETRKKYPQLAQVGVHIHWVEPGDEDSPLREENRLLIRMSKHEDQDKNFLQASMVFIAFEFLKKSKRYMSEGQSKSLDVFFAHKLLEREKPHILDKFFEEYYSPAAENDGIADLLERYGMIEKVGLFFPVLVQELQHLGEKVYFKRNRGAITEDVTKFIRYLERYSKRKLGDEATPLDYTGTYLRCGIVIVAKRVKRNAGDPEPYVHHVEKLLSKKIETVYLIGQIEDKNMEFMESIILQVTERFGMELLCEPCMIPAEIFDSKGERRPVKSYVASLRSRDIQRTIDREYEEKYIKVSATD